jgi:signal transduction histidine kinase
MGLAVDNDRLTAELRASRDRLRRSLTRIVKAADEERRRIARDLHDGLQGRLVVLAMQANALGNEGVARDLNASLQSAIAELRALVQGVMPAILTERGLPAAAEEIAYRCPIPVALDVGGCDGELPGAVESTGYFVVAEALANAMKHSHARAIAVRMTRHDGTLRIEVADDGVGEAKVTSGAGVRGMADRVEALGGRLSVMSPREGGTSIVAEVPCAS